MLQPMDLVVLVIQVMVYDSLWSDASALVILYDMLLSHHNKSANYRYRPRQRIVNIHDS
jgi:hypothetical protein